VTPPIAQGTIPHIHDQVKSMMHLTPAFQQCVDLQTNNVGLLGFIFKSSDPQDRSYSAEQPVGILDETVQAL